MKKYQINKIFYSIQGEGPDVGLPVAFVRFSGCNLNCGFCDTKHDDGTLMDMHEIKSAIHELLPSTGQQHYRPTVVMTGGEPTLQIDEDLVRFLYHNFRLTIETNGEVADYIIGHLLRLHFSEVVVSPKTANYSSDIMMSATALKLLVPFPDSGFTEEQALTMVQNLGKWRHTEIPRRVYLQPLTPPCGAEGMDWLRYCKEAQALSARWHQKGIEARVVPQVHVLMRMQ